MPAQTWNQKIRRLWAADQIHGIELVFDSGVLALRYTSVSYWSKDVWLNRYLDWREISDKRRRRLWRDNLIDLYCISQFLVLCAALFCFQQRTLSALIAGYILFEMYLNLFTIFFLPRQKEIGPPGAADSPSAVNEPSTSVERSILLLFVNVLQLVLSFAVFYRRARSALSPFDALSSAVLVFGTVGTPLEVPSLLVALQVLLDFLLVAAILASFVGQAGPFAKK